MVRILPYCGLLPAPHPIRVPGAGRIAGTLTPANACSSTKTARLPPAGGLIARDQVLNHLLAKNGGVGGEWIKYDAIFVITGSGYPAGIVTPRKLFSAGVGLGKLCIGQNFAKPVSNMRAAVGPR